MKSFNIAAVLLAATLASHSALAENSSISRNSDFHALSRLATYDSATAPMRLSDEALSRIEGGRHFSRGDRRARRFARLLRSLSRRYQITINICYQCTNIAVVNQTNVSNGSGAIQTNIANISQRIF